jgi:shikimate dehydrogenase
VSFLDDIGPVAKVLDAVNSVYSEGGLLYGYNTDCHGFAQPLRQDRLSLQRGRALILGNGGAARAVLYSLYKDFRIRDFTVAGRSGKKLQEFKELFESRLENVSIETVLRTDFKPCARTQFTIVVNCTPLGGEQSSDLNPLPPGFDWKRVKCYYDLNYNLNNKAIHQASEAGVRAVNGSAMLVAQAIRSFEIWTGQSVEFEPIYEAVFGER